LCSRISVFSTPAGGLFIWHSTQNCSAEFSLTETNLTAYERNKGRKARKINFCFINEMDLFYNIYYKYYNIL